MKKRILSICITLFLFILSLLINAPKTCAYENNEPILKNYLNKYY